MKIKEKDSFIAIIGLILIGTIVIVSLVNLQNKINNQVKNLGETYLLDISIEINRHLENEIDNSKIYIENLSNSLGLFNDIVAPRTFNYINNNSKNKRFNEIWIGTLDGYVYTDDKNKVDISKKDYFQEAMKGNSGISPMGIIDESSKGVFLIYSSIKNNEGEIKGVVIGVYKEEYLRKAIDTPILYDSGYLEVFQKDGKVVENTRNETGKGENFYEYFDSLEFSKGYTYEEMKNNILNGDGGYAEFTEEDGEKNSYYNSIEGTDLYSIIVVSRETLMTYFDSIKGSVDLAIEGIVVAFIAIMALMFYFGRDLRGKLLNTNNQLSLSNDRFKIAIAQSKHLVIEYDIVRNTFTHLSEGFEGYGFLVNSVVEVDSFKETTIEKEFIPEFQEMVEKIKNGEKNVSIVVKSKKIDGSKAWERLTFTSILNDKGEAIRAIGTLEDITKDKELEFKYLKEEQNSKIMTKDMINTCVINISKQRFEYINNIRNNDKYLEKIKEYILRDVMEDDYEKVRNILLPQFLRKQFLSHNYSESIEYRVKNYDNIVQWNSLMINIILEPETKDLLGYIYIKDITKEKEAVLNLKNKAEIDVLTGIYNRATAVSIISKKLSSPIEDKKYAFLMIDLDGFKSINDTYGHILGDNLLREIGTKVSKALTEDDTFGRIGGDEFIILLDDIKSKEEVKRKVYRVQEVVRNLDSLKEKEKKVSASIGISMVPEDGTSYEEIYEKADEALYEAKRLGKDKYIFKS